MLTAWAAKAVSRAEWVGECLLYLTSLDKDGYPQTTKQICRARNGRALRARRRVALDV